MSSAIWRCFVQIPTLHCTMYILLKLSICTYRLLSDATWNLLHVHCTGHIQDCLGQLDGWLMQCVETRQIHTHIGVCNNRAYLSCWQNMAYDNFVSPYTRLISDYYVVVVTFQVCDCDSVFVDAITKISDVYELYDIVTVKYYCKQRSSRVWRQTYKYWHSFRERETVVVG